METNGNLPSTLPISLLCLSCLLMQERAEPADLVPAPAAAGGPAGLRAELAPGPGRPARPGEVHRVHAGHGRAVRSQRHRSRGDLRSGQWDNRPKRTVLTSRSLVKFSVFSSVDVTGLISCYRDCGSWAPPPSTVASGDKYVLQTRTCVNY